MLSLKKKKKKKSNIYKDFFLHIFIFFTLKTYPNPPSPRIVFEKVIWLKGINLMAFFYIEAVKSANYCVGSVLG
jgi:hypothetical protein